MLYPQRGGLPCTGSPPSFSRDASLLAHRARDIAKDVLDLVAQDDQDHDHDHRDQDENEGVLYHALPFLTVEQLTETEVQAGQHLRFTSFRETSRGSDCPNPSRWTMPVLHGIAVIATRVQPPVSGEFLTIR